ncbi:hypothetical protein BCV71DRAFT_231889 [Rhizopus microsporus]|uniref:Uncharacterized protein n=1 Tax=Rhizopus microsporus TaxID=58291 RepID=A0A1X0SC32_RHIZD|nr:hypothetical protein BCV71DRAFT_231889 [Rhizopus microsporus]
MAKDHLLLCPFYTTLLFTKEVVVQPYPVICLHGSPYQQGSHSLSSYLHKMSTADEDYFAIDSNRIPKNSKALPSDLMTPFSTSSEDQTRSLYSRRRFIPNRWTTPSIKSIRTAKLKRMRLLIKQPHLPEFETQTFCENCEKYSTLYCHPLLGAILRQVL